VKTDEKLDKIVEDISEIKVTLAGQAADIKYHIKRTDLAEEHLRKLEDELKPVQKHVEQLNGILKAVGGLAVLASIIKAGIEVAKFLG
jgi:cob(I)alamin adenosyltransferase